MLFYHLAPQRTSGPMAKIWWLSLGSSERGWHVVLGSRGCKWSIYGLESRLREGRCCNLLDEWRAASIGERTRSADVLCHHGYWNLGIAIGTFDRW